MEKDVWSTVAVEWAALWGDVATPVQERIAAETGIGPGTRVLDVGCGSGEFLDLLLRRGAVVAGADTSPAMVGLARTRAPGADVRVAPAERLPWSAQVMDVVTAVNALQFAQDTLVALAELRRVTRPGGLVAVANWAERGRNDLDAIEVALAGADGADPEPSGDGAEPDGTADPEVDGDLRAAGQLERLLADAGLDVRTAGLIEFGWTVPDGATLVRAVLLGEDEETRASLTDTVLLAARHLRTPDGGYRLVHRFRFAVGVVPS